MHIIKIKRHITTKELEHLLCIIEAKKPLGLVELRERTAEIEAQPGPAFKPAFSRLKEVCADL